MQFSFSRSEIQPLIEQVVASTLAQIELHRATLGDRIAFPEAEAAARLGLRPHVLRDARLRGEIVASRVGKKIVYERDELLQFLQRQRQL